MTPQGHLKEDRMDYRPLKLMGPETQLNLLQHLQLAPIVLAFKVNKTSPAPECPPTAIGFQVLFLFFITP